MEITASIWDKRSEIKYADGTPATAEQVMRDYPFTREGVTVMEYLPNGNVGAIDDLAILRAIHGIDDALAEEEALAEYIRIRNTPPAPSVDPVEAKLDYLVMMSE